MNSIVLVLPHYEFLHKLSFFSSQSFLGASGFLASHCIEQFFAAGWNVKGTVRSLAKADHLKARFPKLELVEVKDLVTGEGLAAALIGVDSICHTASPYQLTVTDPMKDFIEPGKSDFRYPSFRSNQN